MKRKIIYSHRNPDKILDLYEKGEPFYLYTGRGSSSGNLHIGHYVPFIISKYMQEIFDVPLVIQITDDKKSPSKDKNLETYQEYVLENIKNIIAIGFDARKTFIFCNTDYIRSLYPNFLKLEKYITFSNAKAIFGFNVKNNIDRIGTNVPPPMEGPIGLSLGYNLIEPSQEEITP